MRPTIASNTVYSAAEVGLMIYNLFWRVRLGTQLSQNTLIEYLDKSSLGWESCILASSKWSIEDQNYLVSVLEHFKIHLSVCASYSHHSCY